ncbi:MAG: FAD-dependent tricarballylate dehydrogenase TcuA [Rhodospirillaceae bacterium]|jgi:tricarballylate dehydrogenase|nr:FAD-dependent tricarballylate dehydrogenase TcuA [Rhodospirillaceae bacterium]MBT6135868.1 FAD-dependent tricarballylate dehydrogenase TcuA [Rhodospirillaceae bacterium]
MSDYDVVVIGAGNAALAAANSAKENGAERILVLEKAPEPERGGNTYFSGGLFRIAFDEPRQLEALIPDAEQTLPGFFDSVLPYTKEDFWGDLLRVTHGKTDRDLATILIDNSFDTIKWVHEFGGVKMEPATSLSAIRVNGKLKWQKGAIVRSDAEGVGLSKSWFATTRQNGIEIRYATAARQLLQDDTGAVVGVEVREPTGLNEITARSVVLACGGFEANSRMRAQYLGAPWDHAKVRGTAHNQGDGLTMALEIGALPWGQWSGRHSTPISNEWPDFADRERTDKSNRLSYPYCVMINRLGKRFVDEGEDVGLYTYAKYGGEILRQPGSLGWQIFDQQTIEFLEPRYRTSEPITSDTLEGLVEQLDIDDKDQALATLEAYNAAGRSAADFDATQKDGLGTKGLSPEKANWATKLDKPPFVAYSATGGITFTFGGVKVDERANVIGTDWRPIPGLYACGEMVGGLFHFNYPGGTGLVSGAVFGRIAGRSAAGN